MRKAAGFLLVLLLATLVIITTSSGDQTDNSHQVHLTDAFGPQITCETSCHTASGFTTGGLFLDGQNLTSTTVCDACHSPLGAYDGVDDPNIGAKPNWATGVFTGGDFQTGKEKWCVGCHDGVPSVINSVSAPNIAGESNSDCTADGVPYSCCTDLDTGTCVDYGYYHTGHGKYVSESITCLACHDPDSEHVLDNVARTYSAGSNNYQAGYRLKSVGGQAPLVIPRPAAVSADQFRQCFSCHNSAPFMVQLNTNTNFRADVDESNSCLDLVPPLNRHWEHLSIDTLEYDSDFDGGADSPPSCPACHNVHGPRLRVGVNNAPGMIRTGELIGRGSSLDLDYFINPCPDTTLSPTNETVDSTGGMMLDYGPGDGSIATSGVCDMCHTEAQPYWRVAKEIPDNDFSGDGNAGAWWGLDNGALTTDSIGTNTLTDNNTVGTDTTNLMEGDASADFESSNSEYLSITDANLDSGFPLKSGGSGTFSVAFWYKAESQGAFRALVSKLDHGVANSKTFQIRDSNGTLQFYIGHTSGTSYELLDASYTSLTTGVWYHIGATFNNTTKAWQLRVYENGAGVVYNASGTATNNISITTAPFAIGTWFNGGTPVYPLDGLIDEVVVFSDILTTGQIDQIRQGTYYAGVYAPTTTTIPPTTTTTTTTTLPPTTTTTLPPVPGDNDFSLDGNAVALWRVDNGTLTTDSIGTNTLTDNNTVGSNTVDYQEGQASADFESSNSEYLSITDDNLDSGFPLKSGESGTFSVTFWYKAESQGAYRALVSKLDHGAANSKTFQIRDSNGTLQFYIGYNSGTSYELLDNTYTSLTTDVWYHIGATFNNTTKAWQLRVWNQATSTEVHNESGTATNNISITDAPFAIGTWFNNGTPLYPIDGLIDEVVVFRDILTTGEIDQIRQGTYAVAYTPTTTTTLPRTPNDFSLDGNTKALWSFENGALTTDSIGTNTLTDNNTVGTDTVNYIEGAASADFESSNSEYLSITDADLDPGFPLKSGGSGTFSVTFWYKAESQGAYRALVSKLDHGAANSKTFQIRDSNGTLQFYIGYNSGTNYELLDASYTGLTTGVWYHIGATFNNTTKAWQLRVWNDSTKLEDHYAFGTATKNISITDAPFAIGTWFNNGTPLYPIDGLIDEVVVFRDILTTGEIDQIRQGTYAGVSTTTTTIPPTTTTTLPRTPNDFSGDGNAVALWSVNNGALTTDSIGTNTLTDNNTVGTDTVNYIEGDASADFESSNSEYLSITDANLDSGFPLKSGESGTFSVTFWYKAESQGVYRALVSKLDHGAANSKTFQIRDTNGTLQFYIGHNSGISYELLDASYTGLTTGQWYHIGATFNNTTKAWQLRVYEDGVGEVHNASGTATNNISITGAPFAIGTYFDNGTPQYPIDGLIDEIVVFDDILTTGEIDKIRQGTYEDLCPTDPNKTEPGVCGCDISEWYDGPTLYCIDNDTSHSAHLTEASGPPIASCDVCHVDIYVAGGLFTDGQVFASTTVCNSCHSPGGAYNGVDSTSGSVGAKYNWVSGVYDTVSGGLLQGKEKWCVGCHDDGDSTINEGSEINGVIAPNMAGDDIEYGYYKTGHGKHNNEQGISCLACHEPAVMHVDGVSRTYSAAADNYQDGYRLKLVDGEVALDVPRSGQGSVEQFRLCFTCHDSAPYMNFDNTDTNFRADVDDDTGDSLNPLILADEVNKHFYHLFGNQAWDSDWDGVETDSAPSCAACHNVHGPKLKSGATHAPGMIRTGELIGRESQGALNLDYFNNPWPDTTTSPDNELSGSTGGQFMSHGTGNGSVTKNGVCDMCHNEVDPYWREAKDILNCVNCHDHSGMAYNPAVDTSQPSQQGCAECHHDYDTKNGTSLGLSTFEAIFLEHDIVGDKDGSPDTCAICHSYDGSGSAPLTEVQNAIANGTATCATCHPNLVPDVSHAPTSGTHLVHYDIINGPDNPIEEDCSTCHSTAPYFKSGTDDNPPDGQINLDETDVCDACHQDGRGTAVKGIKDGWDDPGYDDVDCMSCHTGAGGPDSASHPHHEDLNACESCHAGSVALTTAPEQHLDGNIDVYSIVPGDLGYPVDKEIGTDYTTCSNLYCHSDGTSVSTGTIPANTTPDWGLPMTCGGCHALPPAYANGSPKANSHSKHAEYDYSCDTCHASSNIVTHVDTNYDLQGGNGASFDYVFASGGGTCNNISCHGGYSATWGETFEDACTACHGSPPDHANTPETPNSHSMHDLYGYSCAECHYATTSDGETITDPSKHINGVMDVTFSDPGISYNSSTHTCSNTYCHSNGITVEGQSAESVSQVPALNLERTIMPNISAAWGSGSLSCISCHSGDEDGPDYPDADPAYQYKSNGHQDHQFLNDCSYCHFGTTTNGTTITNKTNHVNGTYDLVANPAYVDPLIYTYDAGGGTCNVACHGASPAFAYHSPNTAWYWGYNTLTTRSSLYNEGCLTVKYVPDAYSSHGDGIEGPFTYYVEFYDSAQQGEEWAQPEFLLGTAEGSSPIYFTYPVLPDEGDYGYPVLMWSRDANNHRSARSHMQWGHPVLAPNQDPVPNFDIVQDGKTITLVDTSTDPDYNSCGNGDNGYGAQVRIDWNDYSSGYQIEDIQLTDQPSNAAVASHTYSKTGSIRILYYVIDNDGSWWILKDAWVTVPQ